MEIVSSTFAAKSLVFQKQNIRDIRGTCSKNVNFGWNVWNKNVECYKTWNSIKYAVNKFEMNCSDYYEVGINKESVGLSTLS
jgi:hypothetical protein